MTKPVRLDDEAEAEINAAVAWYDSRAERTEVGDEFLAEIDAAIERIGEHPAAFQLVPRVSRKLDVRSCPLHRFPFSLMFVELATEIRVVAAAHHRKRPGYWRSRL
jgi:toxin ParE1/3/4